MLKILIILAASFAIILNAECIQILPSSGYGNSVSNQEINRLNEYNAQQDQLEINRENLRIQQQMLIEMQNKNFKNNFNNRII
jgi:outer membrane murein-binding lipoprotein Lpp